MSVDPSVYKEIFEDDRRGAAILEDLLMRFRPKVVTTGGIDAVLQTYRHAAHRELLEWVVSQINRANGVPEENAETGE
ncbi:hypothetical protein [Achromobacter sp.]|uniref:hypothetical protein n=1 Tax=Achromobacter sp. TaxID=134375 RepID=UPI000EE6974E|nr:hypothetical protein [Achromobacter sp.]MDX3986912.1 hypothetical protein [Achromobacter sp.]HCW17738.1 hypothetical protein [Achromobacter sp.]